jgi:hypothetical protein
MHKMFRLIPAPLRLSGASYVALLSNFTHDTAPVWHLTQVMKDAGMPVEPWMLAAPKIAKKRRRELAKKPIRRKPIIDGRSERKRARVPKPTKPVDAGDEDEA